MVQESYILGIDLGGTNIRLGLVDNENKILGFEKHRSFDILLDDSLNNLSDFILDYINRHTQIDKISKVSLGVPAVVNKNKSYVYSTPNLFGLDSIDLGSELSKRITLPIIVDRDVNLILTYDIKIRNLDPDNSKTILGFYLGTGFGNSLYINGKIHLGKHGSAGELGHIPLYGVKNKCSCGQTGCAETLVSGKYLQELVKTYFSDCLISDVFTKYGSEDIIIKFIDDIALTIATEITLLDPDYIILGGGVITMNDFPVELLKEKIKNKVRHPFPAQDLNFIVTENSQTCGIVGGAMLLNQVGHK